jgi:chloramphenicol 3-O phosphotransferase
MGVRATPGAVVVLNGAPRSGKTSLARAIQEQSPEIWMNLGVDLWAAATPPHLAPGIGLRPGAGRPDLETHITPLYRALYAASAAVSRSGLNVVLDVAHHEGYTRPLKTLQLAAMMLDGLPAWLVGVRVGEASALLRRASTWGQTVEQDPGLTARVRRWEAGVHDPGIYDLVLDESVGTPEEAARRILALVNTGLASAFARIRETATPTP